MAESANIRYTGKVVVTEKLEGNDTANISRIIHSRVDDILGSEFNFDLASVTEFSLVKGLTTTTGYVDITFSDATTGHTKDYFYDGMTATSEVSVDFLFAKIESGTTSATPDATFKFANQTAFLPRLKGVGDFMIIPISNYSFNTANYDVEVISSGASQTCKVTVLIANRD